MDEIGTAVTQKYEFNDPVESLLIAFFGIFAPSRFLCKEQKRQLLNQMYYHKNSIGTLMEEITAIVMEGYGFERRDKSNLLQAFGTFRISRFWMQGTQPKIFFFEQCLKSSKFSVDSLMTKIKPVVTE